MVTLAPKVLFYSIPSIRNAGAVMGEFIRAKWPEIVIIVLMLGGFGHLILKTGSQGERLVRQETRVDSIIAALPDLRSRSAFESIFGPFRSAIVVTNTFKRGSSWVSNIYVIDPQAEKVTVYRNLREDPDDQSFNWTLAGSIQTIDSRAISFEQMEGYAVTAKYKEYPPDVINKGASFISYKNALQIENRLKTLDVESVLEKKGLKTDTWPELIQSLKDEGFFLTNDK